MSVGEIRGVQNPVTGYARSKGWYARRMQYLDRNGCPDTWFFRNGQVVICEWKRGALGRLRKQQERRIAELRDAGMDVYVIGTANEGYALFDRLDEL